MQGRDVYQLATALKRLGPLNASGDDYLYCEL